jgi:hypothetical protein
MFIRRTIYSEPKHTWGSKMVMPIPDVEVIDPRDFAPSKLFCEGFCVRLQTRSSHASRHHEYMLRGQNIRLLL